MIIDLQAAAVRDERIRGKQEMSTGDMSQRYTIIITQERDFFNKSFSTIYDVNQ